MALKLVLKHLGEGKNEINLCGDSWVVYALPTL